MEARGANIRQIIGSTFQGRGAAIKPEAHNDLQSASHSHGVAAAPDLSALQTDSDPSCFQCPTNAQNWTSRGSALVSQALVHIAPQIVDPNINQDGPNNQEYQQPVGGEFRNGMSPNQWISPASGFDGKDYYMPRYDMT
jgi:hypothetical protein